MTSFKLGLFTDLVLKLRVLLFILLKKQSKYNDNKRNLTATDEPEGLGRTRRFFCALEKHSSLRSYAIKTCARKEKRSRCEEKNPMVHNRAREYKERCYRSLSTLSFMVDHASPLLDSTFCVLLNYHR